MSRVLGTSLLALLLFGCNAAKDPYSRAAQAESTGKLAEARVLYGEVCPKKADSPLCPLAKKRIDRLAIDLAYQAIERGEHTKAKELLVPLSASSEDAAVKRAAGAALEDVELVADIAFEEALAATKAEALIKMEALSLGDGATATRAREWVAKNGPALLLEAIKAACKPSGTGSCVELSGRMVERYAGSPEATEAEKLEAAEYERLRKPCRDAENLIVQRLEIYIKNAKFDACLGWAIPEEDCKTILEIPTDAKEPFSTGFLDRAFDAKLGAIDDPGYVRKFHDRYARVGKKGEYDAEPWVKRDEKKR